MRGFDGRVSRRPATRCPAGARPRTGGGNSRTSSAPPARSSIAAGRTRKRASKHAVREYLAVGRALAAKVQAEPARTLCDQSVDATRWAAARILPRDARQASGPGGTPVVERGNHSRPRESVFPLRTAHRMDPERQATPERGTGPQASDRDRSASIDPGLRRVDAAQPKWIKASRWRTGCWAATARAAWPA